jgi:molybdopterin-guanine dinucleotide biosynthesis protein A
MVEPESRRRPARSKSAARPVGVILAGGRSRRMGGPDKCLLDLAGTPLIERVIARFAPQVGRMVISANGDPGVFARFGLPVVPDPIGDFAGPLAGILGGMLWAREHVPDATHVATAAADTPFLPLDLVDRLRAEPRDEAAVAVASSGDRLYYVFGLWPLALAEDLRAWLGDRGNRAVHLWLGRQVFRTVAFGGTPEPFFNVNTPADLATAESRLSHSLRAPDL